MIDIYPLNKYIKIYEEGKRYYEMFFREVPVGERDKLVVIENDSGVC